MLSGAVACPGSKGRRLRPRPKAVALGIVVNFGRGRLGALHSPISAQGGPWGSKKSNGWTYEQPTYLFWRPGKHFGLVISIDFIP